MVAVRGLRLHIHVSVPAFLTFIASMGMIGSTITYLGPGTGTTAAYNRASGQRASLAATVIWRLGHDGDCYTQFPVVAAALLALRPG